MSRGKRPSVALGRKLPKRGNCAVCGKNGVCGSKPIQGRLIRECQYCRSTFVCVGIENNCGVYELLRASPAAKAAPHDAQ